jgi:hypothetical protein
MHVDDDDNLLKYTREASEIEWHFVKNQRPNNFFMNYILPTKISKTYYDC